MFHHFTACRRWKYALFVPLNVPGEQKPRAVGPFNLEIAQKCCMHKQKAAQIEQLRDLMLIIDLKRCCGPSCLCANIGQSPARSGYKF